jgi:hypothetical protein
MKKILFGTLVFSLILSSLAYAETDDLMTMKDMLEAEEEAKIREKYLEGPIVSESTNENKTEITATATTNMSSEEEREAYAALERARARIEKEEQEKLKAQQEIAETQNQVEVQAEAVTEQGANENPNQNQVVFVEPIAPRMTPEEEKEAYEALERVRARILKEDEERAELLKAAAEQQVQ